MEENNTSTQEKNPRKLRGFATMTVEDRKRIASNGGKAAHRLGKAHRFSPEEAREAGRKGGLSLKRKSQDAQQQAVNTDHDKLPGTPPGAKE